MLDFFTKLIVGYIQVQRYGLVMLGMCFVKASFITVTPFRIQVFYMNNYKIKFVSNKKQVYIT